LKGWLQTTQVRVFWRTILFYFLSS
jgi:hypothetical protein